MSQVPGGRTGRRLAPVPPPVDDPEPAEPADLVDDLLPRRLEDASERDAVTTRDEIDAIARGVAEALKRIGEGDRSDAAILEGLADALRRLDVVNGRIDGLERRLRSWDDLFGRLAIAKKTLDEFMGQVS